MSPDLLKIVGSSSVEIRVYMINTLYNLFLKEGVGFPEAHYQKICGILGFDTIFPDDERPCATEVTVPFPKFFSKQHTQEYECGIGDAGRTRSCQEIGRHYDSTPHSLAFMLDLWEGLSLEGDDVFVRNIIFNLNSGMTFGRETS